MTTDNFEAERKILELQRSKVKFGKPAELKPKETLQEALARFRGKYVDGTIPYERKGEAPIKHEPIDPVVQRKDEMRRALQGSVFKPLFLVDLEQTKLTRFLAAVEPDKRFVLLLGDVGTGKTQGALSYLWEASRGGVVKASVFSIMASVEANRKMDADWLQMICDARNLIIDDIGAEETSFAADKFKAFLFFLIDYRYERTNLRTVITGNISRKAFEETYGDRIMSRVKHVGTAFVATGKDFRSEG